MPQAVLDRKTDDLAPGHKALLFVLGPVFFVLLVVSLGTPIPRGQVDRETSIALLRELFPDHEVTLPRGNTAPIAVLFHLIRSAEPEIAERAILFAAKHDLGHAAPYVIERLGSGGPELEAAAQGFLRQIAGADYGPDADAWRAWWRNPPRNLLGVAVGERTFAIAVPSAMALTGVLLIVLGARRQLPTASFLGGVLLFFFWFNLFGLAMVKLIGAHSTCTFGTSRIDYYSDHGVVVGLEDARLAGGWFVLVLMAAFLIGPLLFTLVYEATVPQSIRRSRL